MHHKQRLSSLLFLHAYLGQGKQVSQGDKREVYVSPKVGRSSLRSSFSNNGYLRWAALSADSAMATPRATMEPCRWRSTSAIEKSSFMSVWIATHILQAVPSFGVSTAAISGCRRTRQWAGAFGPSPTVTSAKVPTWMKSSGTKTQSIDDKMD